MIVYFLAQPRGPRFMRDPSHGKITPTHWRETRKEVRYGHLSEKWNIKLTGLSDPYVLMSGVLLIFFFFLVPLHEMDRVS